MSEIADFLRARYAERRALAEAAVEWAQTGDWRYEPGDDCVSAVQTFPDDVPARRELWTRLVTEAGSYVGDYLDDEIGAYIAANDPAFVIADLNAKLTLVHEIDYDPPTTDGVTDQELHARCAHPAWEYRTTTGPRKQWDGVDDPPCDDYGNPEPGWERNLDAGCPGEGWERFDYTEESYWRRQRPDGPRPVHIPRALQILAQPFAGHPDHKGEEWTL